MPLYEYECDNCHEVFEVIEKFSDEPLKVHAKCGGGPVRRLLSAPALQFKGSGWYVTDYAKGSSGSPGKPASSDGASSDGKKPSDPAKSSDSSSSSSTNSSPSTSTSDKK